MGSRQRSELINSVFFASPEPGPASALEASQRTGRSPTRLGPPFRGKELNLRDLRERRATAAAHGQADATEAEEHHRPGARLRNGQAEQQIAALAAAGRRVAGEGQVIAADAEAAREQADRLRRRTDISDAARAGDRDRKSTRLN